MLFDISSCGTLSCLDCSLHMQKPPAEAHDHYADMYLSISHIQEHHILLAVCDQETVMQRGEGSLLRAWLSGGALWKRVGGETSTGSAADRRSAGHHSGWFCIHVGSCLQAILFNVLFCAQLEHILHGYLQQYMRLSVPQYFNTDMAAPFQSVRSHMILVGLLAAIWYPPSSHILLVIYQSWKCAGQPTVGFPANMVLIAALRLMSLQVHCLSSEPHDEQLERVPEERWSGGAESVPPQK